MSEEQQTNLREVRRIVRVLERLCELAKQATRHGTLRDGQSYAVQQYNAILAALAAQGIEPPSYFPPLPDDAGLGALGFASAQLAEYLSEFAEAQAGDTEEAGGPGGAFSNPFFGSGDFRHIGEAVREAMPEWIRESRRWRDVQRGKRPAPPGQPGGGPAPESRPPGEQERRLAELSARIAAVAAQMRQPGLSPEDLQRLAAELARLGEEQARAAEENGGGGAPGVRVDVDL